MHAIVCHEHGPPGVMRYEEVPEPEPGPGEVLVRTEAIGVNYVDTMRRSGNHPSAPEPPFTPGIEAVGRVVAVGPKRAAPEVGDTGGTPVPVGAEAPSPLPLSRRGGERWLREGDRVIARCVTHGAYAELVRVEERFAVPCPEEIPAEEAAAIFVNGQTAYHALVTVGRVKQGETVLITAAAGGVGTWAVQIAKLLDARVIAAASTPEKREVARQLGADVLVDYTKEGWHKDVVAATQGRGADLILESVGGGVFQECLRCWAPLTAGPSRQRGEGSTGGRMVVFGRASSKAGVITGDELLFGNRSAHGLAVGMVIEDAALLRASMEQLFGWVERGRVRVLVGEKHALRDAARAHERLEARKTVGKIVLAP